MTLPVPNNALLWNGSLGGYLAGQLRGRALTAQNSGTPPAIGTPDASYAALAAEGVSWATKMDAANANDHAGAAVPAGSIAISVVATGVAIVPSTGAIQFGQIAKSRFMEAASLAAFESRYYAGASPLSTASFAALAAVVNSYYLIVAAGVTAGDTAQHNVLIEDGCLAGGLAAVYGLTQSAFSSSTIAEDAFAFFGALAEAVDTLIANDGTISAGNGLPLEATTGVIQQAQFGKFRLMESVTLAFLEQRATGSLAAGITEDLVTAFAAQAPILVAAYNALVGGLISGASTANNPLLYNEAYCGFVAANLAGRPFTSASSSDANYVAVGAAAAAFASEVDLTVGAVDVAGTPVPAGTQAITAFFEGNNVAIVPTTGPIQEGQLAKTSLMWSICRGTQHGRPLLGNSLDATPGTYSNVAQSIVALYLEMAATCINNP